MTKFDMAYGRQGGRVVPWTANDPEPSRCAECGLMLKRHEEKNGTCAACSDTASNEPSLFDEAEEAQPWKS